MRKMNTDLNEFPLDGQYVLGYVKKDNWLSCQNNNHYWKVVKFERGITADERASLKDCDPRKFIFESGDEHSNNKVGWHWKEFGQGSYFGQEISIWYPLDELDKE